MEKGHLRSKATLQLVTVVCLLLFPAGLPESGAVNRPWDSYPAYYQLDEWTLDWSSVKGLTVEAHRIVRVNSSTGADVGRIRIWDTFFQRLKTFEGKVSDTLGHVLYTVGKDQVRAVAPFSEFRLYSGDVIRAVDLVAPQPPYVIEARWTVKIDNPFFWPDWVLGDNLPRQRAVYRVAVPKRDMIRYRQVAPSLIHTVKKGVTKDIMTWELQNWAPEQTTPQESRQTVPLLYASPLQFRIGRRRGRTDSWEALGRWYWRLTSQRLGLTGKQVRSMAQQLRDIVGPRAQAAALKDWVSDDWRYVAIEVGLGGWQPHPSREVFDNRYGDCKDVVFLWVSMIRQLGLEAYPALIRSRDPSPVDPTFPKDWFDHVVGMAIIDGDTLWADLSDSRYRLGTLPHSCEARWALVVGEFGGRLVQTPCRPAENNQRILYCEGNVDAEGNLDFSARMTVRGHYAEMLPLHGQTESSSAVAAILGIAPPAVEGKLDRVDVVSSDEITMTMHGRINGWALGSVHRMIVRPGPAGWMVSDTLAGRPDPARVDFPQIVFDTLMIRFPPDWSPEFWPVAPFRSAGVGEFGEGRDFRNDSLIVIRHLRWDSCERSDTRQHGSFVLRSAYRNARVAEWVFRHDGAASRTDSANGDSDRRSDSTVGRGLRLPQAGSRGTGSQ